MEDFQQRLVEDITKAVNARHAEALRAIRVLATYLAETDLPEIRAKAANASEIVSSNGTTGRRGTTTHGVVVALPTDRWVTVEELHEATKIEPHKIRAVLYGKKRSKHGIESRVERGRAEFRRGLIAK